MRSSSSSSQRKSLSEGRLMKDVEYWKRLSHFYRKIRFCISLLLPFFRRVSGSGQVPLLRLLFSFLYANGRIVDN